MPTFIHFSSVLITLIASTDACMCRFFSRSHSLALSLASVNFSTGRHRKRFFAFPSLHSALFRCSY